MNHCQAKLVCTTSEASSASKLELEQAYPLAERSSFALRAKRVVQVNFGAPTRSIYCYTIVLAPSILILGYVYKSYL